MKKQTKIALLIALVGLLITLIPTKVATYTVVAEEDPKPTLTHRQKAWVGSLEWCESQGIGTAINEVDKDGTPSYYWFQFKPGTFRGYGEQYGLIEKGKTDAEIMVLMKNYELTYAIIEQMVMDKSISDRTWRYSLFPGCVAKNGPPPRD